MELQQLQYLVQHVSIAVTDCSHCFYNQIISHIFPSSLVADYRHLLLINKDENTTQTACHPPPDCYFDHVTGLLPQGLCQPVCLQNIILTLSPCVLAHGDSTAMKNVKMTLLCYIYQHNRQRLRGGGVQMPLWSTAGEEIEMRL